MVTVVQKVLTLIESQISIHILFSAILDGYNSHQLPGKSKFLPQKLRIVVAHEVKKAVDDGILALVQVDNDVNDWCDRMELEGTYVDHTFIEMSARVLDSDIVVVSLHGNATGPSHMIRAGLLDGKLGQIRPGKNLPIFIGYFEDEKHTAGHFQSLMPFRDSDILDMVKADGGIDAAEVLDLPPRPPNVPEEKEISITPGINSNLSPPIFRIPILKVNRNQENEEWLQVAAAIKESRRIRGCKGILC